MKEEEKERHPTLNVTRNQAGWSLGPAQMVFSSSKSCEGWFAASVIWYSRRTPAYHLSGTSRAANETSKKSITKKYDTQSIYWQLLHATLCVLLA